jgi:hypothetical protein
MPEIARACWQGAVAAFMCCADDAGDQNIVANAKQKAAPGRVPFIFASSFTGFAFAIFPVSKPAFEPTRLF